MNLGPTTQGWTHSLSFMQQAVLLSAIRGCDGMPKLHKHKPLVKWYRRCILLSAFDGVALTDPWAPGGGSFTGPLAEMSADTLKTFQRFEERGRGHKFIYDWRCSQLQKASDDFMDSRDELPAHYTTHFMHAIEVVGYKHPDLEIREFWHDLYVRMVHALHTWPETEAQMDKRLGDNQGDWEARGDVSCNCSD